MPRMYPELPEFEQYWRDKFRRFALACDDDAGISGWTLTGLQTRVRHFCRCWAPDTRAGLWLDAGCGAGTYTRLLLEHGYQVVGLDYSHPSLLKARLRVGPAASWAVADVRHLPFAPGAFRGVLCFGVTQTLTGMPSVLRELIHVAADGGEVWLDGLNRYCIVTISRELYRILRRRRRHLRYEDPWRLKALAARSGLAGLRLFWLPILPRRFQRYQWLVETRIVRRLLALLPPLGALLSHSFLLRGTKKGNWP